MVVETPNEPALKHQQRYPETNVGAAEKFGEQGKAGALLGSSAGVLAMGGVSWWIHVIRVDLGSGRAGGVGS